MPPGATPHPIFGVAGLERTSGRFHRNTQICKIYEISQGINVPKKYSQILDSAAEISDSTESIGDFVRKCITVLDNIP